MLTEGAPKSFEPGVHLFIPYCGRIHEVVVEEDQSAMCSDFVNVRFLTPPAPVIGKVWRNPRAVRRGSCFTEPKYALNEAWKCHRARIEDSECAIRRYRELIYEERVKWKALYAAYKEAFSGGA